MGLEGVQQLGVAETDAAGLHLQQHLVGAHLVDRFGGVEHELVSPDDLDGVLSGGNLAHVLSLKFLTGQAFSMTWPPVTGTAWPVS